MAPRLSSLRISERSCAHSSVNKPASYRGKVLVGMARCILMSTYLQCYMDAAPLPSDPQGVSRPEDTSSSFSAATSTPGILVVCSKVRSPVPEVDIGSGISALSSLESDFETATDIASIQSSRTTSGTWMQQRRSGQVMNIALWLSLPIGIKPLMVGRTLLMGSRRFTGFIQICKSV